MFWWFGSRAGRATVAELLRWEVRLASELGAWRCGDHLRDIVREPLRSTSISFSPSTFTFNSFHSHHNLSYQVLILTLVTEPDSLPNTTCSGQYFITSRLQVAPLPGQTQVQK